MATEDKGNIIIAMLEEMKSGTKNQKQSQIDISKVDSLTEQMSSTMEATTNLTAQLSETIEQARKPVVSERKLTLDIVSKEVLFIFIGMLIIISGLSSWLYLATRPNYDRADNDLKYRYIKMKGEATPQRLTELENVFEIERDNTKICQLRKDVEEYERAIKQKATLDEQARLRQLEAEKLNREAESLKNK